MKRLTLCVHGGPGADPLTGAVNVPIYQVTTYKQEGVGRHKGYDYSRTANPTRAALEQLIAELEGGRRGLAFASGMAAISTVLMLLSEGDHVVCGDDVYGGTYRVLVRVFERLGIQVDFVDTADPTKFAAAFRPETKLVLLETPTNPLLKVTDLGRAAELAHARGALVAVDNTFMTPFWQRPLELGADLVVHSATKYLGGHSDVVAGLVVAADPELGQRLAFLQNAVGAVLGPQDCYYLIRGIKTLGVRMRQHEQNARMISRWLAAHPAVARVHYPGLPDHPGHALAATQAGGFGGMLSFVLKDESRAQEVVERLRLFTLAESLGAVESLVEIPALMTHQSIPPERRRELGIADGLVRLSIGIEDPEDLIDDLDQALEAE